VAAAPGPLAFPSRGAWPQACPSHGALPLARHSRSARPRNEISLTLK